MAASGRRTCPARDLGSDPVGEGGELLGGPIAVALYRRPEAGRLRHLGPQVDDGGCRDRAEAEQQPPGEVSGRSPKTSRTRPTSGPDDEPESLHREDQADQPPSVVAVGVLAHQDGRDRVVAPDAEAEHEAGDDQPHEARSERRGEGADDHDDGDHDVHPLAAEQVGDPSEDQCPDEGAQDRRSRHPARLGGVEVPLGRHERGHRADDEEVVGVGEEPHARHQNRPMVETADGRVVQEASQVDRRLRQAVGRFHLPNSRGLT